MLRAMSVSAVVVFVACVVASGCQRPSAGPPKGTDQAAKNPLSQPAKSVDLPEKRPAAPPPTAATPNEKKTAATSAGRDPATLDQVIAVSSRDNKEEAVAEFLLVDWQKPASFSKESPFGLTEQDMMALSPSDRMERINRYAELKNLCRSVVEEGRKAAAAGDRDKAERHFTAVRDCARFLAGIPNAPLILKEFAKGFDRMGSDAMEKPRPEQPKESRTSP